MASASDPSDPEIRYLPYTRNRGPCTLGFDGGVLSRSRATPTMAPLTGAWRPMLRPPSSAPLLLAPAYLVMGSATDLTTWSQPVIT